MDEENKNTNSVTHIRLPNTLSVREVMTLIGIIVSIVLAWGVFSTRITVLEKSALEVKELKTSFDAMKEKQHQLELQIKELEGSLRELKRSPRS